MTPPLSGVRILDLTRLLPGGVCTMLLADMGAQVIKIEDPNGGDYARWMPPLVDGLGAFFRASNRGKQSVILNLKDERGQAVLKRLAAKSDVLIEGNRPGVMARLACDYNALKAANPGLIYCSLSGWGQDGPYAQHSGHDLNYLSIAGMLGAMHRPQPLGGQVADVGGALVAVGAILAALFQRERTGEGAYLDTSLFESGLLFMFQPWIEAAMLQTRGEPGALTGGLACYNMYTTHDGRAVSLAALEAKFWTNFCDAVRRPDLVDDYLAPSRQAYLMAEVAGVFALRTADEWDTLLRDADCCYAPVNPVSAIASDSHIHARGLLSVGDDGVPTMRSPFRLPSATSGAVPDYGAHTRMVLLHAGYTDAELDALYTAGVAQG